MHVLWIYNSLVTTKASRAHKVTHETYNSGSPSLHDTWQGTCLVNFCVSLGFLAFSIHSKTPCQIVCLSLPAYKCFYNILVYTIVYISFILIISF